MGQQQLLLMILVTVLVGLMTIVGIVLFESVKKENIKDSIRQDMFEAASIGQMYYKKPSALGGGNGSFANITLDIIHMDTSTVISRFTISETAQNYFKITADPLTDIEDFTAVVYSNRVEWE